MLIHIKKGKDKADTLSIDRDDGSSMTAELSPFTPYHDLAHFAVETIMGYKQGFFGMLASGVDIQEFYIIPEERGWPMPDEGYYAEFLSGLIQASVPTLRVDPVYVEFLKKASKEQGLPFPELPPIEVLEEMRMEATRLTKMWEKLPAGETLSLEFPLPT